MDLNPKKYWSIVCVGSHDNWYLKSAKVISSSNEPTIRVFEWTTIVRDGYLFVTREGAQFFIDNFLENIRQGIHPVYTNETE